MIVVSNTTPILSLNKVGLLYILRELFGQVFVPKAVYNEITVLGKGKQGDAIFNIAAFIQIKDIQNAMAASLLISQLDYGEAESIVLAGELKANILLLDEKKARKIAKAYNQEVIGTIGVIQMAKNKGLIPVIKLYLDELIKNGIWIERRLYQSVLDNNNE